MQGQDRPKRKSWNRREVLRAAGGGVVAAGAALTGGELVSNITPGADPKKTPSTETVPKGDDFSWLTAEHAENLLGGAYHARDVVSFKDNLNDGWKHEGNTAVLEDTPGWHGRCTIAYEMHQVAESREGITPADLVTHESIILSSREKLLAEPPVKIVPGRDPIIRANLSAPSYGIDVGAKNFDSYFNEN